MKTIIETARDAGKFTTLIAALKAAGLTDTLNSKGPFTVFAPTDEAFKKIGKADLDALLKDTVVLKAILTYHVVPGNMVAKDIKAGALKTVQGTALTAALKGNDVTVNGAKVVQANVAASNGVIHAIDTVVMPVGTKLPKAA
jgi:uncharacterized surface protein with fasciclin (FAS1) repeats